LRQWEQISAERPLEAAGAGERIGRNALDT
jgi:hypothetical protein